MEQHVCVKAQKETVCDHSFAAGSEELDVDVAIRHMKKVGYFDSDGYTVLPKDYDD